MAERDRHELLPSTTASRTRDEEPRIWENFEWLASSVSSFGSAQSNPMTATLLKAAPSDDPETTR